MRRLLITLSLLAPAASTAHATRTAPRAAPPRATALAITGVTVIDVAGGRRVPGQTVVLAGTRISVVGPSDRTWVPNDARVVDGRGKYLIPGLVDTHVHLRWGTGGTPDTLSLLR